MVQPLAQAGSTAVSGAMVSSVLSLPALMVTVWGLGSILEMVRACAGGAIRKPKNA